MSRPLAAAPARSTSARRAVLAALVAAASAGFLGAARSAGAQAAAPPASSWELLFSSGALVPTGAQRDALKDAPLSTAQLSYVMRSRFALTTSLGWARSRDLRAPGDPKLDVFTWDVGVEARAPRSIAGDAMTFTPFAGLGAGSRSYNHRSLNVDATHNLAGYGAVGGELGKGRLHVRLEVRDYLAGFKPLAGSGVSGTRNDVVALVGLRLGRRGT